MPGIQRRSASETMVVNAEYNTLGIVRVTSPPEKSSFVELTGDNPTVSTDP
jgi:hypothetical protein